MMATQLPRKHVIEISTKAEGEVVEISLQEISNENREDVSAIRDALLQEDVPLKEKPGYFLEFALEFYKRDMFKDFEDFVRTGISATEGVGDPIGQQKLDALKVCLAAYEIRKARAITDPTDAKAKEKQALHQSAINHLNRAERKNPLVILAKSLLMISQQEYEASMQNILQVSKNASNIVAMLVRAGLLYHKKEYKTALSIYQNVLRILPDMKRPNPRIGIGLCYYQLGYIEEARKALLRAEEMDPSNDVVAAVLMEMDLAAFSTQDNAADKRARMNSAFAHFKTARGLNSRSAVPSLFRAEQLFVSGDYTQARQYANAAFTNTDFAPLKARALIIAGKIQHVQGNFDMALKNYERALSDSPDNLLVLYLMAQILFQRREYDKAIDAIETALKVSPNEPNFLKLLVYIYARRDENETPKALQKWELMQAALRRQALAELKTTTPTSAIPPVLSAFEHVTDADFCLALARMFEKTGKTEQAIDAYRQAASLLEKAGSEVPASIWNNLAALAHLHEDMDSAQTYYMKALQAVTNEADDPESTTILYNIGRMYETIQDPDKAAAYFQRIVDRHPSYFDAALRLGAIEWAKGKNADAKNRFTDVATLDESNLEALIMIGLLQYSDGQVPLSRKTFETVLSKNRSEPYSLVQLGNILVEEARRERSSRTKKADLLQKAMGNYIRAIAVDEFNSYAADGIGIVFAEAGDFQEAERTFEMLKHNAPNLPWARVNRAHALVEMGVNQAEGDAEKQRQYFQTAISEYEAAFRHSSTRTAQTLHGLSRAYYIIGRAEKSTDLLLKSLEYAEEALKLNPDSKDLRYDVGQIKLFYGFSIEQRPKEARTVEDVERALAFMKVAGETFRTMSADKPSSQLHMEHNTLKVKAEYCEKTADDLTKSLDAQRVYEDQVTRQKRLVEEQRQLERDRQEEEARLAREKRDQEDAEKYAERIAKIKATEERMLQERQQKEADKLAAKERGKKKKAKKDDFIEDDEAREGPSDESDAQASDGGKKAKGKKVKRKRREESQESVDSSEVAEEGGSRRSKKKKILSEERVREVDSDEEMEDAAEERAAGSRLKLKRRAATSDEENGEEPAGDAPASDAEQPAPAAPEDDADRFVVAENNDNDEDEEGLGMKRRRKAAGLSDDDE